MNTLEITERQLKMELPSHWDEMNTEQLQYILRNAWLFTSGKIGYHDFMLRAFYKLGMIRRNWKSRLWERLAPKSMVDDKNANAFILAEQYCSFLLKKNKDGLLEINFDTVVNPFPKIKLHGQYWYGPADLLSDLTFGEFRSAMEEMNEYFQSKDEQALLRMIACIYRPAAQSDSPAEEAVREPFKRSRIEKYAGQLADIPEWQRMGILLWFTWCINYIQSQDLIIEGRELSLKVLFPKAEPGDSFGANKGLGWTGILFSIAKEGIFGNIEQTDKASLFDVLLFMYDNHLQKQRNKS